MEIKKNKKIFVREAVLVLFFSLVGFFADNAQAAPACGTITSGVPFYTASTCDWTLPSQIASPISISVYGAGGGGGDDDNFEMGNPGNSSTILYNGTNVATVTGGGGGNGIGNDPGINGTVSTNLIGGAGGAVGGRGGAGCIDKESGGWGGSIVGGSLTVSAGGVVTITTGLRGVGICENGLNGWVTFTFSSSNDSSAPSTISNLSSPSSTTSTVNLTWTAPGDDANVGVAAAYDVRYSTSIINDTNWNSAIQATGAPTPSVAGSSESMVISGLNPSTTYYFAIVTRDEVPNFSSTSNIVSKATAPPSAPNAPTGVTASPVASGQISIAYNALATENGSSITRYDATCTSVESGAVTPVSGADTASPFTAINLSGLTDGKTYSCELKATNAIGQGSAAIVNNVVPSAGFTITSILGTGGTVSVTGGLSLSSVMQGSNRTINYTANSGYTISHIYVDGVDQGAQSSPWAYTFSNVNTNHVIEAVFDYQTGFANTATFTSKVKKLAANVGFGSMILDAYVPNGTQIKIRVRSTASVASGTQESDWVMSDPFAWSDSCNMSVPSASFSGTHTIADITGSSCLKNDSDLYVQYQIILTTVTGTNVPWVNNIRINTSPRYPTDVKEIISSKFDTGNDHNAMRDILWTATNIGSGVGEGTVKFQLKTAATEVELNDAPWCGPGDASNCNVAPGASNSFYTASAGSNNINSTQEDNVNDRWFQYAAFFTSNSNNNGTTAPVLTSVTTQYSFNTPPVIDSLSYVQNQSIGTVSVSYTLRETFDDLGILTHGIAASPIKALLFYQPKNDVTMPALTNVQTGIVMLNNPSNMPIPANGTMLIDKELITFDSAGASGNERNITGRAALFTTSYPTTAMSHDDASEIFFQTSAPIHTVDEFAPSGPAGTQATVENAFVWDPRADATNNLSGNKLSEMVFKVAANDADSTNFNNIGQSAATSAQTLDLEIPRVKNITSTSDDSIKYNEGKNINVTINFVDSLGNAKNVNATNPVTIRLETGDNDYNCLIPSITDSSSATCIYQVQAGDITNDLNAISVTGTITDQFGNTSSDLTIPDGQNIADSKNIIIDTTAPIIENFTPTNGEFINSVTSARNGSDISYQISENLKAGSNLKLTSTLGTDLGTEYVCTLQGNALNSGAHNAFELKQGANNCAESQTAMTGRAYALTFHAIDQADNVIDFELSFNFDIVDPSVGIIAPNSDSSFHNISNDSDVSYNTVERLADGTYLRFTRTGGNVDSQSPRTCNLSGTELNAGSHSNVDLDAVCGGFSLVDGTIYSLDFHAIDQAGNVGDAPQKTNLTFDTTPPILQSFTSNKADVTAQTAYGKDEIIDIRAVYNETLDTGSTLTVRLENNANPPVDVVLENLDGNNILYGTFTVDGPRKGYDTQDLNISEIVAGSENVIDRAGNIRTDSLISSLPGGNLADNKDIVIDTGEPILLSFTAKKLPENIASGAYNLGDQIRITATYSKPIASGSITIRLNTDNGNEKNTNVTLDTISGATIYGTYTVVGDDNANDLKVTSIQAQNATDFKGNPLTTTGTMSEYDAYFASLNQNIDPVSNISDFQVDNISPEAQITDDVDANPNQADTVALSITETNLNSVKYIFTGDNDCASKSYAVAVDFEQDLSQIFNTETNNGDYICIKIADNAGNVAYAGSANTFNIDVANPTATIKVDRSKDSEQINLEASDGDRGLTGLEMRIKEIDNDASGSCTFSDIENPWIPYVQKTDLASTASYVKVCASLRDAAGNVLNEVWAVTPETPKDYALNDLTNETFAGFALTWANPVQEGTGGFAKYALNWCKSNDTNDCALNQTEEILDSTKNYSIFKDLERNNKYCYKLNFEDNNGDVSGSTNTLCAVPGEGPIISDSELSILGNIDISSISESSAKVSFTTIDSAHSNAPLAASTKVYVHQSADLTDENPLVFEDTMDINHAVNLTGLTGNKTYYLRLVMNDASYSGGEQGKLEVLYSLSLHPELAFSTVGILTTITIDADHQPAVITDTKAVVNFSTDQPAKCFIDYKESNVSEYTDINKIIETEEQRNHSITMSPLLAERTYDYKITCYDNENKSNVVTKEGLPSFTTLVEGSVDEGGDGGGGSTTKPEISSVSIEALTGESATVRWNTNKKANSLIAYEVDGATYTLMAGDFVVNASSDTYSTAHTVTVSNLIPATKYNFNAMSIDASGNVAVSTESSFTTKQPSGLSSIKVISKSLGQATVSWETGQATSSLVEYGLTTAYGDKKESNAKVKEHELTITDLKPGEEYHLRVKGTDENGELFASSDITFQPKSPPKISDFKIDSIFEHGATVTFKTNVPTDALITFTNVDDAEDSGLQGNPTINSQHEVKLKELASGETFSIKVKVKDTDGNETEETFANFTTTKDENPPKIDRVKTDSALAQNDKVQAIISWTTDEMATGKIVYKEGKNGDEKTFEVNSAPSFSHIGVITSFKSGVVYYFKVKSVDLAGNEATSTDYAVLTPKKSQNIIQIIIGNFTEIFGWAKF